MNNGQLIKIALVENHDIMRDGLIRQLSVIPHFKVIIQANHGLDLLQQLDTSCEVPDLAIVDLKMPVMDGFELSDKLKKTFPSIRILILSAYSSDYTIAVLISKGIRGYLLKECSPAILRQAIQMIYETGYYYSAIADKKTFDLAERNNLKSPRIPDREMEFLKLCCTKKTYGQIAQKMGISENTMQTYRERLFERLGISSRTALVVFAMNAGISAEE